MAKYQIQQAGSNVNWTGKKVLGIHTGTIAISNGFIEINDTNIERGEIEIDMTSIVVTDIEDKKNRQDFLAHLISDDFFAVAAFNTAKLTITRATKISGNKSKVDGVLTIKDITHLVSFNVSVDVFTNLLHSMGELTVDRTLYNIRYGSGKFIDNLGDKLIFDDFVLQFNLVGNS